MRGSPPPPPRHLGTPQNDRPNRRCRRRPRLSNPLPPHDDNNHKQRKQFVYLREAFCPALDDEVGVLARTYGVDTGGPGRPRELHVSYALVPAWG